MGQVWMPGAVWVPIPGNYSPGQMGAVVGQVEHHMVGPEESADARFRTPGSGASAHFGVTYEGIVFQWVAIGDAAYHACQANYEGQVGVENESPAQDDPNTPQNELWAPLTEAQVVSNGNIARWLHSEHGMVLRVADPNDRRGIGFHSMCPGECGSPHAWGQTGCPGDAVAGQRQAIVDAALGAPVPPPLLRREDQDMLWIADTNNRFALHTGTQFIEGLPAANYTQSKLEKIDNLPPAAYDGIKNDLRSHQQALNELNGTVSGAPAFGVPSLFDRVKTLLGK